MVLSASIIGACSVYIGLLASYHLNIAAGAAITLSASAIFFILLTIRQLLPSPAPVRGRTA